MAVRGEVNRRGDILIDAPVMDRSGRLRMIRFTLDTGFTDDLSLPSAMIRSLGLPRISAKRYEIATGESVEMNVFSASVLWHGELRSVQIVQTEGIPHIGTNLILGSAITMQMWEGGEVIIEERQPRAADPPDSP